MYACDKRKGRRRGYELRKEGKSGKEEGGGGRRREEGEGTKHGGWRNRDREMYTCACVFSVCLCARVCACRCVNVCACMHGKYM